MKKLLLGLAVLTATTTVTAQDLSFTTGDKTYAITTLIDRDLGPGIHYTRMRVPEFPLNINMLRIDVSNPYNSLETTQANDKLFGTESLVKAGQRQSAPGHQAIAGANANFWCVSPQPPYSDVMIGLTYNANMKNGKIITETNMHNDQWDHGYWHTGIFGVDATGHAYSGNNWAFYGSIKSEATGEVDIIQVNKVVRAHEMCLYNSYYGTDRTFRCYDQVGSKFETVPNSGTEVYFTMDPGQEWGSATDIALTVAEVRTNAGDGTLGTYDLALVGRDSRGEKLALLKPGDKVTLNYAWRNPEGQPVPLTNVVGGNAQVMTNGELLSANETEGYNSMVYSRTGYGTNADGTVAYIFVIDKSTDPVYGISAGCTTSVMCDFAKIFGCVHLTNFDAGGSAQMLVGDRIVNKTTEGSPRAVANGMIVYSTAPEDNVITRLAFDELSLTAPIYSSYSPRVLGYNQYGALVNDDVRDYTLSCPAEAGTCEGNTFNAGGTYGTYTLTATLGNATVSKEIVIANAQPQIRIKPAIVIDNVRKYPMEVTASVGANTYFYDPSKIDWTYDNPQAVEIDAAGVLTGKQNGTANLVANIRDLSDQTQVSVEIADSPLKSIQEPAITTDGWETSGTNAKPVNVLPLESTTGFILEYTLTSARNPNAKIAKDLRLYGLPDAIEMTLNPGDATIKTIRLELHPSTSERAVMVAKDVTLTPNTDNKVVFEMSEFGDPADLAFYPVSFKSMTLVVGGKTKTPYQVKFNSINARYDNYTDAVDEIMYDGAADAPAHLYNLQGIEVGANPAPGLYIRRQGNRSTKIIVK